MTAYYNENDKKAAEWLRRLIAKGLIADGVVDTRSIAEVMPGDVAGHDQVHLFAGIGGWSLALRLAGVPDDEPVWTGSCPCQPFSAAGKHLGTADKRHLWPEMRRLIAECRPRTVFGEQVASSAGRRWLGGNENLHKVRDAKSIIGVLQELQGGLQEEVRHLYMPGGAVAEGQDSVLQEICGLLGLQEEAKSKTARGCGEEQGKDEGNGFRFGRVGCSDPTGRDRSWNMSGDRHCLQSGRREDVGQPVYRQDRQLQGLREGECQDRLVLPECHGKRMGREQDIGNIQGDSYTEAVAKRRLAVAIGGISEAASRYQQLSGVRADLEGMGYGVGSADLCAASVGAPHIRQRLYWLADADRKRRDGKHALLREEERGRYSTNISEVAGCCENDRLADADGGIACDGELQRGGEYGLQQEVQGLTCRLANTEAAERRWSGGAEYGWRRTQEAGRPSHVDAWGDFTLVPCRDGKVRRIKSGIEPLAHGIPGRLVRLRGYGNAIVPPLAAEFIQAFYDTRK